MTVPDWRSRNRHRVKEMDPLWGNSLFPRPTYEGTQPCETWKTDWKGVLSVQANNKTKRNNLANTKFHEVTDLAVTMHWQRRKLTSVESFDRQSEDSRLQDQRRFACTPLKMRCSSLRQRSGSSTGKHFDQIPVAETCGYSGRQSSSERPRVVCPRRQSQGW